jgi:Skp family chaperone for outer membrane proteins
MARKKRRGSSVDNIVLEQVNPRRRRRVRVYTVLSVMLALLAAFVGGEITGRQGELAAEARQQTLEKEVKQLQASLQSARDELALHRTSTKVAESAQAQVRQEIKTLRDQVAELEEAVAFYKNVMAPGSEEEGLHIEKLDISATDEANVYSYKLVLTQLGDNRAYLAGQVQMNLSAREADQDLSLGGSDMLAEGSETKFRFRYFQELTGQLKLPEGVSPSRLKVEAVATGRRRDRAEKDFTWQLQEKNGAWAG